MYLLTFKVFSKHGEYKFQFGQPGKENGQLWCPRKVGVMKKNGHYVVCDRGCERSRLQVFDKYGRFVKKLAIHFIEIVAGLAITNQDHIVLVDSVTPKVFTIDVDNPDSIKCFDCSKYMKEPSDIAVKGIHG